MLLVREQYEDRVLIMFMLLCTQQSPACSCRKPNTYSYVDHYRAATLNLSVSGVAGGVVFYLSPCY